MSSKYTKVRIVYSNEALRKRDAEDFADLYNMPCYKNKISLEVGLKRNYLCNQLLILDEADIQIFKSIEVFNQSTWHCDLVAYTATGTDLDPEGMEIEVLL